MSKGVLNHTLTLIAVVAMAAVVPPGFASEGDVAPAQTQLQVTKAFPSALVMFAENVGQFDPPTGSGPSSDVRFRAYGSGHGLWLAEDALWVMVTEPSPNLDGVAHLPLDEEADLEKQRDHPSRGVALRLSFPGAKPHPHLEPFDRLDTLASFFIGTDPAQWHTDVPLWRGVRYVDLYPDVDLEIAGEGDRWTWQLVCETDCQSALQGVRLRVEGADALVLESDSPAIFRRAQEDTGSGQHLHLTTAVGDFKLPLLTLEGAVSDDQPATLDVAPGTFEVSFPFSSTPPLSDTSVQPASASGLLYSVLLDGWGSDEGYAIAVDRAGGTYVTGCTQTIGFPTAAGAFDLGHNSDCDTFVVKMNPDGTGLAYAAFVGGSNDDRGQAVAVDGAGSAYVVGATDSPDFPATSGVFQPSLSGGYDTFALKISADDAGLAYATFLGGSGDDWGRAIAVDGAGSAYVTGVTRSPDFPTTEKAFDTRQDGDNDAFVAKVNEAGTELAYAAFLGGSGEDEGHDIAVDEVGSAYVTGVTWSPDFPATAGSFDTSHNGDRDVFVVKVNVMGTGLVYGTFLEGEPAHDQEDTLKGIQRFWSSRWRVFHLLQGLLRLSSEEGEAASCCDYGYAIAVDEAGHAYVTGSTQTLNFPTTVGAFDASHDGDYDAFAAKVNTDGTGLTYATFLGGISDDWGQDVAVDRAGNAYVVGSTLSSDLPTTAGAFDVGHNGNRDAFVIKVSADGTGLACATFLGGIGGDSGQAIAVDEVGSVYVAGVTESLDFPATVKTFEPRYDRFRNTFVAKLATRSPFLDLPVSYSNFALAALGNVGGKGPGRVNSWFDHTSPNYAKNRNLTRWDGTVSTFPASSSSRIGESWYDGHNGIDFRQRAPKEQVFAAAPGRVINTVTTCQVGVKACGRSYGNQVWIDHGNGYATLYAHLETVVVSNTTVITEPVSQPLGIMGNTGNSRGTHLHFGVYYDQNGDGRWARSEAVDPYGWVGSGSDPWDVSGRYLWKYPLWTQQTVGGLGDHLTSPSGQVNVTIPPEAVPSTVTMKLWDMPPAVEPSAQLRSAGHSSWLQVFERRTADSSSVNASAVATSTSFARPVTVSVMYRVTDVLHLDTSQLTIHRWEEDGHAWTTLSTVVDVGQNQAAAQTTETGRFDLQAPLLCPADGQEPDDHYDAAQTVLTNDTPVNRLFDIPEDEDWFRLEATAGEKYVVWTTSLAAGVDTVVQIYDRDSLTLLASDDDSGGKRASYLVWRAPSDGTYFLRVSRVAGSAYGCAATYELRVKQLYRPSKVAIAGPTTGLADDTYSFTATTSPITATQPITYVWQVPGQSPVTHVGDLSDIATFTLSTAGSQTITVTATNAAGTVVGTHFIRVYTPVQAAFTAAPTFGGFPLTVVFTNLSTGDYTESLWDFGDGQTSTQENPTHTYAAVGTYTVELTVNGPGGSDTETKVSYITVVQKSHRIYLPLVVR